MTRDEIYNEIEEQFGLVPSFFKELPDSTLESEWNLYKRVEIDEGPIPTKYRQLIGLGISAATKCRYCVFYHTALARLNGATDAEIEDAVHYAKSSVGWSTYLHGMEIDFETFKDEVRRACDYAKMKKAA
jgi:AhpD family alkylhydroperoxidase